MTDETAPNRFKTVVRAIGRVIITTCIIATAVTAVIFGQGVLTDRAAAVPQPVAAPPIPVVTQLVAHQQSYTVKREFLGQIEPKSSVDMSFELSGLLIALQVSEGDFVEKGAEIARLDTALLEAEQSRLTALRSATEAQLVFAQTRVDRAENLQKRGFTSIEAKDEATALRDELQNRIAETDAALHALDINISKSSLYAPVSGRIGAQLVDEAETVSPGQTIAVVLETTAPEFRVGLPLGIDPAVLSTASVRVGDRALPAKLVQVRPDIDPVTRTRTALFSLPQADVVVFGETATLTLDMTHDARGFWVSLGALKQGDGSVWTVLAVNNDNLVRPASVEVIHAEQDAAYVRGTLQDGDRIVSQGAHRVVPGQTVRLAADGE